MNKAERAAAVVMPEVPPLDIKVMTPKALLDHYEEYPEDFTWALYQSSLCDREMLQTWIESDDGLSLIKRLILKFIPELQKSDAWMNGAHQQFIIENLVRSDRIFSLYRLGLIDREIAKQVWENWITNGEFIKFISDSRHQWEILVNCTASFLDAVYEKPTVGYLCLQRVIIGVGSFLQDDVESSMASIIKALVTEHVYMHPIGSFAATEERLSILSGTRIGHEGAEFLQSLHNELPRFFNIADARAVIIEQLTKDINYKGNIKSIAGSYDYMKVLMSICSQCEALFAQAAFDENVAKLLKGYFRVEDEVQKDLITKFFMRALAMPKTQNRSLWLVHLVPICLFEYLHKSVVFMEPWLLDIIRQDYGVFDQSVLKVDMEFWRFLYSKVAKVAGWEVHWQRLAECKVKGANCLYTHWAQQDPAFIKQMQSHGISAPKEVTPVGASSLACAQATKPAGLVPAPPDVDYIAVAGHADDHSAAGGKEAGAADDASDSGDSWCDNFVKNFHTAAPLPQAARVRSMSFSIENEQAMNKSPLNADRRGRTKTL